jgi:hypothetical protein
LIFLRFKANAEVVPDAQVFTARFSYSPSKCNLHPPPEANTNNVFQKYYFGTQTGNLLLLIVGILPLEFLLLLLL